MKKDGWYKFCDRLLLISFIGGLLVFQFDAVHNLATKGTVWRDGTVQFLSKAPLMNYIEWCLLTVLCAITALIVALIVVGIIYITGRGVIKLAHVIVKATEEEQRKASC